MKAPNPETVLKMCFFSIACEYLNEIKKCSFAAATVIAFKVSGSNSIAEDLLYSMYCWYRLASVI